MKALNKPVDQQGAVLMFCLVFLLVLTMMGTAGMETAILEEKMTGHWQDHVIAIQAAESALRTGEIWLLNLTSLPVPSNDGISSVWLAESLDSDTSNGLPWWQEPIAAQADWWQDHATPVGEFEQLAPAAYYILEQLTHHDLLIPDTEGECATQQRLYKLTARGSGINSATTVMLQAEQMIMFECNDADNLIGSVNVERSGRLAWRWL